MARTEPRKRKPSGARCIPATSEHLVDMFLAVLRRCFQIVKALAKPFNVGLQRLRPLLQLRVQLRC